MTLRVLSGFALTGVLASATLVPSSPDEPPSWASKDALEKPALFAPGEISTGDFESHPAFTPDGRELYFVKSNAVFTSWTIVTSRFEGGRWTTPTVAPFSGQYNDADPFITRDGRRLYFISNRPRAAGDTRKDMDIWYVDRTPAGWGVPVNPGTPVNSAASEWFPTLAADGTLYFGSGRDGGKGATDLYRAAVSNGTFAEPVNLGDAINTPADEYEPLIFPDQKLLVFMAMGRPDGLGDGDLYVSRFTDGAWTPAVNLGRPINTPALEISPYLTPDGRYLFFGSSRLTRVEPQGPRTYDQLLAGLRGPGNGLGDLYRVELSVALKGVLNEDGDRTKP
jgi:Tol biopolymer transport system component